MKLAQRSAVEGDSVVAIMPAQHLAKPAMLLRHRDVPPLPHLHAQLFQLPGHPRRLRLPLDREPSTSSLAAVVGEAQEVERLRSSQTRLCSAFGGEPPKRDQPGLALIEREAELDQPLLECLRQSSCVLFILGSNDRVVGVANDHDLAARMSPTPLMDPSIKAVVQEDVRQEGANARPLGSPRFRRHPRTALQDARRQPSPYQTKDPPVGYPVLQHPHHPLMVDRVEKAADVEIEHPIHPLRLQRSIQVVQSPMRAPAWSIAVTEPEEVRLIDGVQHLGHRTLDNL